MRLPKLSRPVQRALFEREPEPPRAAAGDAVHPSGVDFVCYNRCRKGGKDKYFCRANCRA